MRLGAALCMAIGAVSACRPSPSSSSGSARAIVEERSPAVGSGVLVQDIGIETLGGTFTVLLARGASVPAFKMEVFSTASDSQEEIEIRLYRGIEPMVVHNASLGRFVVSNIPAAPRGVASVEVTLRVDGEAISIEARDRGGAQVRLAKR